jgi:signal transduction histidine kinase
MSAFKDKIFLGQHQAISISLIYLLISGIWIYVSNYLLFGQFPIIEIRTLAEIEAISDGVVMLATAILIYLLVRRSIATLQQSERALKNQTERLQVLSHKLLDIQENERRAIARELHDEIGQALTGLKLSLEMADRLPQEPTGESLRGALSLANDLISRVRKLSLDLRPTALDDLGLLPALLWHFERYTKQTGVRVDFRHQGLEGRRFERDIETAACRIIQEALTNVARHAHTKLVEVRVWVDEVSLNLRVEDNGVGFDAQALVGASSSGLLGMEERASILGGSLTIDTQPGRGTHLVAELPLLGANNRQARELA